MDIAKGDFVQFVDRNFPTWIGRIFFVTKPNYMKHFFSCLEIDTGIQKELTNRPNNECRFSMNTQFKKLTEDDLWK